jgi:hypothetical protein
MNLWVFIHSVIDYMIDFCFSLFYNDSKRTLIPTVRESFLMESAVSLAERIRNKEVQWIYLPWHEYHCLSWMMHFTHLFKCADLVSDII